jgi:hypothetical protein
MEVLDTNFQPVAVFNDAGSVEDPTRVLVDGSVDADTTRLTRRTFTATVLNEDGQWSPQSDWGGLFYVNRVIRLYRGIDYGDATELVPIGTFLIDHADVTVERNMSMVVLSGSDLWKKFGKAIFSKAQSWAAGTSINTVISAIATASGVTRMTLDPLSSRATADTQLGTIFAVERGDNKGEALDRLCKAYGIDIYFDPTGYLVTEDFKTPGSTAVVYTYDPDVNNNLLVVKSSYSDDNLYNSVLVIGTKDKNNIVTYQIRDTNALSVTNITLLGERVLKFESDQIGTTALAQATATKLFYKSVLVNEDISLETVCNPAYEGNDVIKVVETDFAQLNDTYRLKAFTVPLSSTRQTLRLLREIRLT